ncbi:MAG: extracellular solute-binding protein [Synergistaceae bacterium]|nr:extracellular solute-binding protein [Synergistaceae bacterium]
MKKFLSLVCCLALALSLAACAFAAESGPDEATFEALLAAGKANGNKLTIYTTHSVVVSAVEAFANKFGIDLSKVEGTQIGDNNQITQVATEVSSNVPGADIIFIQDGARTVSELVDEGYVYNWYNKEILDKVGADCKPLLVWDYCNKVFIYNTDYVEGGELNNIWYCTDPKYAGTLQMKDPEKEGVNMNFLVMLTSDENAALLEKAYKDYYGKELKLDADCPNAGYQWIKMMYRNGLVAGDSDGNIAKAIGNPKQEAPTKWSALITLNKYVKNRKDSVAKPGNYTLNYVEDMKPVAGFIYPIYGLITANADNPDLAKAFLVWLFTEEGWQGDGKTTQRDGSVYVGMTGRFGDYSGNQSLPVAKGDSPVTEWKKILIQEDPIFAAANRAEVEDFIKVIK